LRGDVEEQGNAPTETTSGDCDTQSMEGVMGSNATDGHDGVDRGKRSVSKISHVQPDLHVLKEAATGSNHSVGIEEILAAIPRGKLFLLVIFPLGNVLFQTCQPLRTHLRIPARNFKDSRTILRNTW
jgi:hypothetical protein